MAVLEQPSLSRVSADGESAWWWLRDRWVLGAVVVACVLRLVNLGAAPLWHDEVETAIWARLSASEAWGTVLHREAFGRYDAQQLPLYFLIVNAWTSVAGSSTSLLRIPGVVFSIVTVPLVAASARWMGGISSARWSAWLCALSPYLIHHAQEARMYPLLGLLAAGSLLLLVRYLKEADNSLGAGFVLAGWALLATHYYSVFFVCAELLVLVLFLRRPLRAWVPGFLSVGLGIAALAYVALVASDQRSGEIYEVGLLVLPGAVWGMLAGYVWLPSSEQLHELGAAAIRPYLPVALATAVPFGILVLLALWRMSKSTLLVLVPILAGVIVGPFLAYAVFPEISINPRYFMTGAPAFFILLGMGAAATGPLLKGRIPATLLLLVMAWAATTHLADPGQKREDIHAADDWLERNVSGDAKVLVTSDEMASLAYFHWPEYAISLYPDRRVVATEDNADALAEELPVQGHERVIYIFGRTWLSDPQGYFRKALKQRFSTCGETAVRGIQIICLDTRMGSVRGSVELK